MKHYVYKITDPITNQFYYGSRSNEDPETDNYMGSMVTWKPEDKSRLVKEIIKDNFETREDAIEFEDKIIGQYIDDELNENYNRPHKGFHMTGVTRTFSEETRRKMSEAKLGCTPWIAGKNHTDEAKEKIRQANLDKPVKYWKGKERSDATKQLISKNNGSKRPEVRRKISEALTGRTRPQEVIDKISEVQKGVPKPVGFNDHLKKPVKQFDKKGKLIREYESITQAAHDLDLWHQSICACCKGKLKTTGGYVWEWKNF